jgi:hypothetical protein
MGQPRPHVPNYGQPWEHPYTALDTFNIGTQKRHGGNISNVRISGLQSPLIYESYEPPS